MISALLLDAARGAAIALIAVLAARALGGLCTRRAVVALLAAWVAVPALAVAYAWATLPQVPAAATTPLHLLLAGLRLAPVALLIVVALPPPPWDAAAFHCLRLGPHGGRGVVVRWWCAGPGRRWLAAGLLTFPSAFGEFELASRLAIDGWAVRLFDAQAGGQFLAATLAQAGPGVALQLAALLLVWRLLRPAGPPLDQRPASPLPRTMPLAGWAVLLAGTLVLVALPLATVVAQASRGFDVALAQASHLRHELAASVLFASVAAAAAWLVATLLLPPAGGGPRAASGRRRLLIAAALIPGVCGSLVVGLAGLALSRLPPWRALADTPLPLVAALVALLLPFALVLRWLERLPAAAPAWHQAGLLRAGDAAQGASARTLRWELRGRHRWWAGALLFSWAYCDLAASAILHPVDMTPVLVRLYNLMHYGQSTALAVQVAMTLLAPLVLLVLAHALVHLPPWQRLPGLAAAWRRAP